MNKKETGSKPSKPSEVVHIDIVTLSKNPETEGFDTQAGKTWIYPTNYSLREYQYNIIQEALLSNTMVSLPTGLGKTFIAAVVMYNFYRWYPTGKVIFMAPTRPLVKQQIDACYNIMAIPKEVTAELTGTKVQANRKEVWKEKRVFFITPQVLQNDLGILTELGTRIKCIVFDEAHKAKGNYAYCEVIRKLLPQNKHFRVLALSATPGSSFNDVIEVIRNLLISRLEIRTDESPDVTPYIFERSLETVVVPLGEKLQQVRDSYMQILEKYTRILVQHRVITGNCGNLTKGKIFITMRDYQEKSRNNRDRAYSDIMRNLNLCVTLYHAYELLIRHGLRGFLSFYEEHADKPLLRGNVELRHIMQDVREYLGPAPNVEPLPDGSILEIPESTKFGHPKFYKLSEILLSHFNKGDNGTTSRAIVFCEYRESVMEAHALLLRQKPLIKPRIFLGQGAITQKQQVNVIKAFKEGQCNTLISTSIGEEGLDVGEVDLIVCFDISNKSPVRMVQRMGRTGRKREGRVVILVTEGKEQQTLKECLIFKQNLTNHILQSTALYKEMYSQNPRMIPVDITPTCQKIHITVTGDSSAQPSRKKSNSLKDMFDNISNKKNSVLFPQDCDIELIKINDRLPVRQEYWNKGNALNMSCDETKIDFSKKLGKLRALQPTGKIGHTKSSELLVSLLQFAESKKYNIPMTQVPVMPSQLPQSTKMRKVLSSDSLKQADIRNMFLKPPSSTELTPCSNQDVKIIQEEEGQMLSMLYTELSTYLTITISDQTNCKICDNLFDCSQFTINPKEFNIKTWIEPDLSIFNSITAENLTIFADSLNPKPNDGNVAKNINEKSRTVIKTINTNETNNNFEDKFNSINEGNTINFEDSFKHSPFKPPKNIKNILEKSETLNLDDSVFNNIALTQMEDASNSKLAGKSSESKQNKICENILCSLNVNAFEEAEFTQIKTKAFNNSNCTLPDTLTFFNITALDELFNDPHKQTPSKTFAKSIHPPSSTPHCENLLSDSQDTIIYTPDNIQKNSPVRKESGSPVLCSYERVKQLKSKANKRLFENSMQSCSKSSIDQTWNKSTKLTKKNKIENTSMDIFSESDNTITEKNESAQTRMPNLSNLLHQDDAARNSFFKSKKDNSDYQTSKKIDNIDEENDSDLDIIDTSLENCLESIATTQVVRKEKKHQKDKLEIDPFLKQNQQRETNHKKPIINISDIIDLSIFGLDTTSHQSTKQTTLSNKIEKKINCNTDNNVNRNSISDAKSQINKNTENTAEVKKSARDCVSVLQDFCDDTFIDMFLENDPFKEGEFLIDKTHCEKNSVENKLNDKNSYLKTGDVLQNNIGCTTSENNLLISSTLLNSKDNAVHSKNNSKLNKDDTIMLDKKSEGIIKESKITESQKNKAKENDVRSSKHPKKFEEKNEWKEDSIWDFCMNWTKTEDNSIANNEEEYTKEDMKNVAENNSIFNSAVREQQKDENKNYNETQLTSQIDSGIKLNQNNFRVKENEQSPRKQEKSSQVIDLTEDSPVKDSVSPTLLKSQRSKRCTPLKSMTQKLSYPSQNQKNTITLATEIQKKSNNSKSTKTSIKTKLQLNSKDPKNSITSIEWFTKTKTNPSCSNNNNNTNIVNTNSKLKMTVTPTKTIPPQALAVSAQKTSLCNLESNSFEDESDMNESFDFTFNHKKPLAKFPRKQPLQCKISPILNNSNKILPECTKSDITPKKTNLKENARFINTLQKPKNLNGVLDSVAVDDSDDDFELPKKTTECIKTRRKNLLECSKSPTTKHKNLMSPRKNEESLTSRKNNAKKKLEQRPCPYIDHEAEMSMDENASFDTDHEEIEGDDNFEESFVDDETQHIANNTEIHAHYMQSVRSPLLNRGKFKIPKKAAPLMDVFSQHVNEGENTYINDTFCINTEEMELSQETKTQDISELELAELILEQQRIQKKKRKKSDDNPSKKRRRILEYNSDSDQ